MHVLVQHPYVRFLRKTAFKGYQKVLLQAMK